MGVVVIEDVNETGIGLPISFEISIEEFKKLTEVTGFKTVTDPDIGNV
jgi:hypothetical protein